MKTTVTQTITSPAVSLENYDKVFYATFKTLLGCGMGEYTLKDGMYQLTKSWMWVGNVESINKYGRTVKVDDVKSPPKVYSGGIFTMNPICPKELPLNHGLKKVDISQSTEPLNYAAAN